MRKIELTINNNGYIMCTIENNNKISYISYFEILDYIKKISLLQKDLTIINNNIEFRTNNNIVVIKNYRNNKDIELNEIIERLIKEKINKRKEYLRKKKINRNRRIACTVILGAITLSTLFSNFSNVKSSEIKNDITHNNYNIEINYSRDSKDAVKNVTYIQDEEKETEFIEENDKNIIEVAFDSRIETEKFQVTKAYYKDIINNIALEYGIDPQIMLAIATQESGIHDINRIGPAIGLMQIEKSVWNNQSLTAYNYSKNQEETIFITEEKLKDLEFNIRTACMIFQQCLKNSNYNLTVAIQMYNYGYGNIINTFKMCYGNNVNFDETSKSNDNLWLDYRENISEGDKEYLEHILSYIENIEDIYNKNNDNIINYEIRNKSLDKKTFI